jgi:hypothetical protein
VLSACERHFSIAIPHKSLAELVDARSVAAYFDGALRAAEEVEKQTENHWSKTLPSNVKLVGFTKKHTPRNAHLHKYLAGADTDRSWNPARG